MRRFEVGQEYMITHNARPMGLAQVIDVSRGWVTFEMTRADMRKTVRFSGAVRTLGKSCECIVPRDYDAIFSTGGIRR